MLTLGACYQCQRTIKFAHSLQAGIDNPQASECCDISHVRIAQAGCGNAAGALYTATLRMMGVGIEDVELLTWILAVP